jgi:hypothetical protein
MVIRDENCLGQIVLPTVAKDKITSAESIKMTNNLLSGNRVFSVWEVATIRAPFRYSC